MGVQKPGFFTRILHCEQMSFGELNQSIFRASP